MGFWNLFFCEFLTDFDRFGAGKANNSDPGFPRCCCKSVDGIIVYIERHGFSIGFGIATKLVFFRILLPFFEKPCYTKDVR
jgi:hypothetical protein